MATNQLPAPDEADLRALDICPQCMAHMKDCVCTEMGVPIAHNFPRFYTVNVEKFGWGELEIELKSLHEKIDLLTRQVAELQKQNP